MIQCVMVDEREGKFQRIADAEIEDWELLLEEVEGEPQLIKHVKGPAPYTHAYRMPDGRAYLVAMATAAD